MHGKKLMLEMFNFGLQFFCQLCNYLFKFEMIDELITHFCFRLFILSPCLNETVKISYPNVT